MKNMKLAVNNSTESNSNVNMQHLILDDNKRKENRFFLQSSKLLILVFLSTVVLGSNIFSQREFVFNDQEAFRKFVSATQLLYKGRTLYLKGKYSRSEKALKKCLERFPKFADADFFLAQIYYKRNDFSLALEHIKKASVNFRIIQDLKIAAKLKQEGFLELDHESKIKRDKIHANYFFLYGNVLFKLKKFPQASLQYIEAVKRNPKHRDAYNNLINLFFISRNYRKAFEYLKKAELCGIKINPQLKKILVNKLPDLIITAYNGKRYLEAKYYVEKAETYDIEIKQGIKESIINLKDVTSISPDEARSINQEIIKLYNAGKYKEALEQIKMAERKNMKIGSELKSIIEKKYTEQEIKRQ